MITIDVESRKRKRLPSNFDRMAARYKTSTEYYTFTSPDLWTLEKNLYFLLRNSRQKKFESKYIMRPDYLSFDEYKTVTLAFLLMYVNGIVCVEDFNLTDVAVPTLSAINKVCQDTSPDLDKDVDNLTSINW